MKKWLIRLAAMLAPLACFAQLPTPTPTPNIGLIIPATNQVNWAPILNGDLLKIDSVFGYLGCTPTSCSQANAIVPAPSATQTITAPATSGIVPLQLKGNATAAADVLDIFNSLSTPIKTSWFDSTGAANLTFGTEYENDTNPLYPFTSPIKIFGPNTHFSREWYTARTKIYTTVNDNLGFLATQQDDLNGGINTVVNSFNKTSWVPYWFIHNKYTIGQAYGIELQNTGFGIGDTLGLLSASTCYGGTGAGGDEGCEAVDQWAMEGTDVYAGVIFSGASTGSTSLTISPSAGAGTQGAGRFLIDMTQAYTTGTISDLNEAAAAPTVFTGSGTSWTASTVFTTSTGFTGTSPGTVTFTPVSMTGISNGIYLIIADKVNIETCIASGVTGSTFNCVLVKPHLNSPNGVMEYISSGKCDNASTLDLVELDADRQTPVSQVLRWAWPVIGCASSTSMYVWTAHGGANANFFGLISPVTAWTASTGAYALYPAAELLAVNNGGNSVSNTLTLGVNSTPWANTDSVELPHYPSANYQAGNILVSKYIGGGYGQTILLPGLWRNGDMGIYMVNGTPLSKYTNNGGPYVPAKAAYFAGGVFSSGLNMQYTPSFTWDRSPYNTGYAIYLGCTATNNGNCSDIGDILYKSYNNVGGADTWRYNEPAKTWTITAGGEANTYSLGPSSMNVPGSFSASSIPVIYSNSTFAQTPGVAGSYFNTPDASANQITGDIDLRWVGSLPAWQNPPETYLPLIDKWNVLGSKSYFFWEGDSGLGFAIVDGATAEGTAISTADVPFTAGQVGGLRVTRQASTGIVTFYISSDQGATWQQLGNTGTILPGQNIIAGSADVEVAADTGGTDVGPPSYTATVARTYRAQIYNGIAGTLAVDFNPVTWVSGPTWVSATTGETWTIHGNASIAGMIIATANAGIDFDSSGSLQIQQNGQITTTTGFTFAGSSVPAATAGALPIWIGDATPGTSPCSGSGNGATGYAYSTGAGTYAWSCPAIGPTGLTSVGFSTDSGFFAVGNSPLTSNGTLTLNFASGLTSNENQVLNVSASGVAELSALTAAMIPAALADTTSVNGTIIPASQTLLYDGGAMGTPASGNASNLTNFPTLNQSTTGNAATATALAGTPTLCSSGYAAQGILASGNATGCQSISGGGGLTSVGLSTNSTFFTVGSSPLTSNGTITFNLGTGLTSNENQVLNVSASGAAELSALTAAMIPASLTSNTSGSAASLSIAGQTGLMTVTGLTSTNRAKTVRDAADTFLELGGSYTPTGTWTWTSASVTWPTFNQSTSGNAATATAFASYTGYSVYGSAASSGSWLTPTGNGQCLMSGASSYATTTPSFQSCPSGALTSPWSQSTVTITGASTAVLDISAAADLKLPQKSGFTSSATNQFGVDTATGLAHLWNAAGSADSILASSVNTAIDPNCTGIYHATAGSPSTIGCLTIPLPVADGGTAAASASITAFNNITGYSASGATGTTSTNIVFSTSPALTTPAVTTGINDANAAYLLKFTATGTAVDGFTFTNAATAGHNVSFSATGSDTDITLTLNAKGAGVVNVGTGTLEQGGTAVALQGADINSSNQVTITHLASALPINQGGTAATSAANALIALFPSASEVGDLVYCATYSSGCTSWAKLAGNTSGTKYLQETSAGAPSWTTPAGGGTPGGSNTQVQYNNSSAFGGITGFTTDGTNETVGSGATLTIASGATLTCAAGSTCPGGSGTVTHTGGSLTSGDMIQGNGGADIAISNPLLDNGVTAANTLTYAGTAGITALKFTSNGTGPPALVGSPGSIPASTSGSGTLSFSSTGNKPYYSYNAATAVPLMVSTDLLRTTNTSQFSQATVAGTAYYITNSNIIAPAALLSGYQTGTTFRWHITGMQKTGAGTGATSFILYVGTNGSTSDTAEKTIAWGSAGTAVADNATVDISETITGIVAGTATVYYTITPEHHLATTGWTTLSGDAAMTNATGTFTFTSTTASLNFGIGFSIASGGTLPTVTINMVEGQAYNLD